MMDVARMKEAVARGLSLVCASCDLYWEGRARELPQDQCTASDGCCGPLGGGTFHEYRGQITDLTRWCFLCGADATSAVRRAGAERGVGVCPGCLPHVHQLVPVGMTTSSLLEVHTPHLIEVRALVRPAKPRPRGQTVAGILEDIEAEFAERG
jgi:hypothetical protein